MYPSFLDDDVVDGMDTFDSSFFSKASMVPWLFLTVIMSSKTCLGTQPFHYSPKGKHSSHATAHTGIKAHRGDRCALSPSLANT